MRFGSRTAKADAPSAEENARTLNIIADVARRTGEESTKQFLSKLGLPNPGAQEIKTEVRQAIASNQAVDQALLESPEPTETIPAEEVEERFGEWEKLSKLIDDDFPFDESQLEALEGMIREQYACLTGAAGTGKTTLTKKLVDRLLETSTLEAVDLSGYWAKGDPPQDGYEPEKQFVPSVALVSFTGRATQMIKKNFPRDWHDNIMTIHRMLGFYPEFYEEWDDEYGDYRKKMRFIPTYNENFKLPWDIIIVDEAGMLGVDLWHQVWAACKPGCRIYMVGDINQLPPVHGRSVFGFALAKWPAWELQKIHRQQGVNNPIVDNAWRILHGHKPVSEGRFQMIELKGDSQLSSRQVRAMLPKLKDREVYDPIRDAVITPINGEEGSRGYALGQLPLNRELALIFNPKNIHPRYIIDGGRERKQFAVGDKVMATRNDWEAGITNGMDGIIVGIAEHEGYSGDRRHFGQVDQVNRYLTEEAEDEDGPDSFSLADLETSMEAIQKGQRDKREKRERGPSSHIVTVRFGEGDHGIEIPFSTLAEVGSLMTSYVKTCHKMQGGENPTIIIICHDSHKNMLYREWLYTALTRSSNMAILLYTPTALNTALNKQKIKGATLQDKVRAFQAWQSDEGLLGAAVYVDLPDSTNTGDRISDKQAVAVITPRELTTPEERGGGLASLIQKSKAKGVERHAKTAQFDGTQTEVRQEPAEIHIHVHTHETFVVRESTPDAAPHDGGSLTPDRVRESPRVEKELDRIDARMERIRQEQTAMLQGAETKSLPRPLNREANESLSLPASEAPRLLTWQPMPIPMLSWPAEYSEAPPVTEVRKVNRFARSLAR